MPKRTLLIMVAAAAVTVTVVALTSTGSDVVLPSPHPVSYDYARSATAARSAAGGGQAKTTTSTTAPGAAQSPTGPGHQVVPIAPPVVLTGCTVSVSNSRPPKGHTQQTVTVTAVAGAEVRVIGSFPRATTVHSELAD